MAFVKVIALTREQARDALNAGSVREDVFARAKAHGTFETLVDALAALQVHGGVSSDEAKRLYQSHVVNCSRERFLDHSPSPEQLDLLIGLAHQEAREQWRYISRAGNALRLKSYSQRRASRRE